MIYRMRRKYNKCIRNAFEVRLILITLSSLFAFIPAGYGWEKLDLGEYLKSQKKLVYQAGKDRNKTEELLKNFPQLTAYRILEKATSAYLRENILYNIYAYGANFIQSYLNSYDWPQLDIVYKNPPSSTKEIIHPDKYLSQPQETQGTKKEILEVSLPPQWQQVYTTSLGEFFISISLKQFLGRLASESSLLGLMQDKVALYENAAGSRCVTFLT